MQVGGRSERTIDSCTNDSEVNEYLVTAKSIGKLLTFIQAARLDRSPASWPCGLTLNPMCVWGGGGGGGGGGG